jgi:hypothetical protein
MSRKWKVWESREPTLIEFIKNGRLSSRNSSKRRRITGWTLLLKIQCLEVLPLPESAADLLDHSFFFCLQHVEGSDE